MKLQPYQPSEFIVQALFINAYKGLERKKGRSGRGPGRVVVNGGLGGQGR